MPHEIEKDLDIVGLHGKQAWHNLGVVIQDELTAVEASKRFGLTWPVGQWQLEAIGPNGDRISVPTHVANVRTEGLSGESIQHLLGIVGADYQVCQNQELAEFTDALAQTGRVVIESCGSIRGGKRVWFLARGESFTVGGNDEVYPYVLVSNGHDGGQAIRVTPTTIRVVCSNTLHMVVPREGSNSFDSAAITIRHSGHIADKLVQARKALEYYGAMLRRNREVFDMLQSQKWDREQGLKLFADSYAKNWEVATQDDLTNSDERIRRTAQNRVARMERASELFMQRYADEQSKLGTDGNAWTYLNAMTGYIQHDLTARGSDDSARVTRRVESNLFGLNSVRTSQVLADVMNA